MVQLVGQSCVICGKRIRAARDADFCSTCNNPVHQECLADHKSTTDSPNCPQCGGDPALAPLQEEPARFRIETWLLVLAALAIIGVIFITSSGRNRQSATEGEALESDGPTAEEGAQLENPILEIETTMGTIRAELFLDKAPMTARNFIELVNEQFYDGILFHRVIDDFMIQTGDPLGIGTGGRTDKGLPAKVLRDEFHRDLRHDGPGILSMANSGPNTGDTQFFITTVPTPHLDNKHAIFGKVIEGMDVVHAIGKVETARERPIEDVKMIRVQMVTP